MSRHELIIQGARQNNLRNISLRIPHNKVVAVTGLSGSGKSSLAFETIFAEGQWRFIESLSTYARLFLEKMDRPDVDAIDNIRPAIALEQRNPVRGSRSTVGSLTELYDFLRLLYAKVSAPYCPRCGAEIRKWDSSAIVAELLEKHGGRRAVIIFESGDDAPELRKKGFLRVWEGAEARDLDEAAKGPPFEVVLDRLVIRDEPRLSDSVEMAFAEGGGRMKAVVMDGPELVFTALNACDSCGVELPDPAPLLFSFNHPLGACPECKGFGNVLTYAEELVVPDPYLSLSEGAVAPWEKPAAKWWKKKLLEGAKKAGIDVNRPYRELTARQKEMVFKGGQGFYGVNDFFQELESMRYKLHVRVFLSRYRKGVTCPSCGGKRLRPEALAYRLSGLDIAEVSEMSVGELSGFFKELDISPFQRDMTKELLSQVEAKVGFLKRVGLDYLTLSRQGRTLSGGEYQRVNLSNQLGSRLTGTLYVLDEPTVGLHPRDTARVSEIMKELASIGNTIVVVEHERSVMEAADWIVELGPGSGQNGGEVVFSGPRDEFLQADTLTARFLRGEDRIEPRKERRAASGRVALKGARGNNLKDIDFEVPLGTLEVVTGVSGSGKSTLVVETLYKALARKLRLQPDSPLPFKSLSGHEGLKSVKLIDQAPIGRSPRSNPVTYLKVFDPIRKLFAEQPEARAQGWGPGFFSFNVPGGRCETCKGEGYQRVEMYFFEDLYIKCEDCGGRRYGPEALRVKYRGKSIYDVLNMTVEEAEAMFGDVPQIRSRLALMAETGLGYLRLGQPATTLSGGEAQRLKICAELGAGKVTDVLYILDEPTVGLHHRDIGALLGVLHRLVDAGNTVLIIEHNLDVIQSADWVVDLGPEGGDRGGEVVFSGTPDDIVKSRRSHTGRFLRDYLKAGR
ncbi:MAG: excinuclease ABC subunit UvrA [Thermodesulfovibrionales bacterium]